jgi:hypothetical protein
MQMKFTIGEKFRCNDGIWRCTDIGTRTIVAIRIDRVLVTRIKGVERTEKVLSGKDAEAEGWFRGPPYPVVEHVFDEDDQVNCTSYEE